MLCSMCLGTGCLDCGGRGHKKVNDRPLDIVTKEGDTLIKAYKWLKNYSIFPVDGGLQNQSAKFARAVEYCDIVNSSYHKLKEDLKSETAMKIQAMNNMMQGKKRGN